MTIGIGYCIPNRKPGINWSSYWKTRFPSNLIMTLLSGTSVRLNWTINGTPDWTGHKVFISTDNVNFTLAGSVEGSTSQITIEGLTEGTPYYCYVKAYKGSSLSQKSNTCISMSPSFDKGKVVFTFDDGGSTAYNHIYPLFATNAAKATFYLVGGLVNTANYITWTQALEMHNAGMDMQGHSMTHPQFTTLTDAQIIEEIVNTNAAFISNGLPIPRHLAYPGGAHNTHIMDVVEGTGLVDTARIYYTQIPTAYNFNGIEKDDKMYAVPVVISDDLDATKVASIKQLLDLVKEYKTAIVFAGHSINDQALFTEIITYAQGIGNDIVTMSELYQQMTKNVTNAVVEFDLEATGDGTGVSSIGVSTINDITLKLSGNAKFYTNAAGTEGESLNYRLTTGATIYIKNSSGVSKLTIEASKVAFITSWATALNSPKIRGNISFFRQIHSFTSTGGSEYSGNANNCSKLRYFYLAGALATSPALLSDASKLKALGYFRDTVASTFTSAIVNKILADIWANKDQPKYGTDRYIDLRGNATSQSPTGQGITDKNSLLAYRTPDNNAAYALWTIVTR